jgi:isocitrate lyase
MGYKFQFVTLAGFHSLNHSMFELARGYAQSGMAAYSELQEAEFASEANGYSATRHQREVGTGYFDAVSMAISGGQSSTTAMAASTEAQQFHSEDENNTSHNLGNGHETVNAEVDSVIYQCVSEVNAFADVNEPEFINQVYRCVQHVKASENFQEANYARIKEAYREIEEFARVDDE